VLSDHKELGAHSIRRRPTRRDATSPAVNRRASTIARRTTSDARQLTAGRSAGAFLPDLTRFHNLGSRSRGDKRIALSPTRDVFERSLRLAPAAPAARRGRSGIASRVDLKTTDSIYLSSDRVCEQIATTG